MAVVIWQTKKMRWSCRRVVTLVAGAWGALLGSSPRDAQDVGHLFGKLNILTNCSLGLSRLSLLTWV